MTREDVKKIFGEEITDEQITAILNQHNSEVATEKGKTEKAKADAKKAEELQAKLDEIEKSNMSDLEKANKATEDANNRIADLEKQIKVIETKKNLAEQGITGEVADKLIESLNGGNLDTALIGQIISEREKAAVAAHEKDQMDKTPDAGGKGKADTKSSAEKIAEGLFNTSPDKKGASIIDNYIQ